MYDRTALHAAAHDMGDRTPSDLARRLKVARNTGWRLWHGKTAPSADLIARVEREYGLTARQLTRRAT
ncbi:XRE family transcriptional regulator [Streptomyces sp. P11-1]|uniref:XRE family transcriptional regulator n=1 Tax=Streptomyces sp. P11-1 TaxID=3423221 RepID=UPI003D2F1489